MEGETFFHRAAGCEVGDTAQKERTLAQQPNPGARNLLQPKLPDPRLAHLSG